MFGSNVVSFFPEVALDLFHAGCGYECTVRFVWWLSTKPPAACYQYPTPSLLSAAPPTAVFDPARETLTSTETCGGYDAFGK